MGLPLVEKRNVTREVVINELNKNYRLALLYFWPSLQNTEPDLISYAAKLGFDSRDTLRLRKVFYSTGLWTSAKDGKIDVATPIGRKPGSVLDYLTLTMMQIARMSEDGPNWYEFRFVATNQELKTRFYDKLKVAISEFRDDSQKVVCDTVVAWSLSALDCVQFMKTKQGRIDAMKGAPSDEIAF